jgi:type II secretory pathway pseudopilin PulG
MPRQTVRALRWSLPRPLALGGGGQGSGVRGQRTRWLEQGGAPQQGGSGPPTPHPRTPAGRGEKGFTLAALLVIMAVMAVFLGVAMQSASFQVQREKEEELVFRGNQIVEAIRLFRARNGRFPTGLKQLAEADPRVLRKQWSDPITGKTDWVPVFLGQDMQSSGGGPAGGQQPEATPQAGQPQSEEPEATPGPTPGTGAFPDTLAVGPVIGVHSRSCATSIKVVDGRTRYCDWNFVFDASKIQGPRVRGGRGPRGSRRPSAVRP